MIFISICLTIGDHPHVCKVEVSLSFLWAVYSSLQWTVNLIFEKYYIYSLIVINRNECFHSNPVSILSQYSMFSRDPGVFQRFVLLSIRHEKIEWERVEYCLMSQWHTDTMIKIQSVIMINTYSSRARLQQCCTQKFVDIFDDVTPVASAHAQWRKGGVGCFCLSFSAVPIGQSISSSHLIGQFSRQFTSKNFAADFRRDVNWVIRENK